MATEKITQITVKKNAGIIFDKLAKSQE